MSPSHLIHHEYLAGNGAGEEEAGAVGSLARLEFGCSWGQAAPMERERTRPAGLALRELPGDYSS